MKNNNYNNKNKSGSNNNNNARLIPNSFKFISSCIKTVSSNVRSASASVASSISGDSDSSKDQVLWASFDKLELSPSCFNHVLLLGYSNGFQVLDVEDSCNVNELVSRRDNTVTFLQIQPMPAKFDGHEGFKTLHPMLVVVACEDEPMSSYSGHNSMRDGVVRDGHNETQTGSLCPTSVQFYSLRSQRYVQILRFRSTVYMVRCSPRVVAVGLITQIHCFDALTLESKFSVLTYPVPQSGGQGTLGLNIGYGPMAVGTRWLAYASNNPLMLNTARLSPQSLTPSPGVTPSTSPGSTSLVSRYAMESSKQLAAGLINLGDMGYKTLSKYYQELLSDSSSPPVSSNLTSKIGRGHSNETDMAGMVVVKDLVSKAVISQFRAHTSPISALCFDPSGTLLVTASIYGHNINIFRIMPSSSRDRQGTESYDWSSSHVHLYKLHRGITSAIIQDICFSNYSQWIAIVSSRGTCHVFILSPFGGDTSVQTENIIARSTLLPAPCQPWWSTASFMVNQHSFPQSAPSPVFLNVVSRIKDGSSGWLNTVSNAASSAAGKAHVPSGAVTAVFHKSLPQNGKSAQFGVNALEYLLAYAPSGHLIQYKLLPSLEGEKSETAARQGLGSVVSMQDEDLKVKVEPLQWWDVCRRTDWPEREPSISVVALQRQESLYNFGDTSDFEHTDIGIDDIDIAKPPERSHQYLSNAEVQIRSGRKPIWQNSKIYFQMMVPPGTHEQTSTGDTSAGIADIEKVSVQEVDIRRKYLLPVFNHLNRVQCDAWSDRGLPADNYPSSSRERHEAKDDSPEAVSRGPLENVDGGLSIPSRNMLDIHQMDNLKSYQPIIPSQNVNVDGGLSIPSRNMLDIHQMDNLKSYQPIIPSQNVNVDGGLSIPSRNMLDIHQMDNLKSYQPIIPSQNVNVGQKRPSTSASSLPSHNSYNSGSDTLHCEPFTSSSLSEGSSVSRRIIITEVESSNDVKESPNTSSFNMRALDVGSVQDHMDFGRYFQEEYFKPSALPDTHEVAEAVSDMDINNNSPCDREKSEEDGEDDNDELLGAMFSFSEEG